MPDPAAIAVTLPVASALDSHLFYIGLMLGGFAVAVYGHVIRVPVLVGLGILVIVVATVILPLAVNFFGDPPPPPEGGPLGVPERGGG